MEQQIDGTYNFLLDLFSNAVKTKRAISIKELSEQSGVSTAVISDFENKKYMPKIEILLRLFYVLNIKLSDLAELKEAKEDIDKITTALPTYEEKIKSSYMVIEELLKSIGLTATETNEVLSYIKFKAHDKINTAQIFN